MRIFISSTSEELEPHQAAAIEVVHDLGFEPVLRDPAAGRGLDRVTACARQVASADLLLAIVGWRGGRTPAPEVGGDGFHPWMWWETQSAFAHGKPVVALLAAEGWRPELREAGAKARAVMRDFRGELGRLAVFFDDPPGDAGGSRPLDAFRRLVRGRLTAARRASGAAAGGRSAAGLRLRRWPPPRLPERPYPLLLPYTHPDLMAGRERELDDLDRRLRRPLPILGLYAPSGTGKSSLLAGGLVPALRAAGRPVAFDRHPCEAGLAGRLIGDLAEAPVDGSARELDDEAPQAFVDRLLVVRHLAGGEPAILVIDQFEDLLRSAERRPRALMGTLLAASIQRLPGVEGPLCRWLLAYREEYHGELFLWLGDVLRDAGAAVAATLPRDLSGPERFQGWPLPALGTPAPESEDPEADATRVFQAAIEKPLAAGNYPWRFAGDGAERLARAFAQNRARQPKAPLVPELQVVLAHLLASSAPPSGDAPAVVEVPGDPTELIDRALERHLKRALDAAFPAGLRGEGRSQRTRALLALRELAGAGGRREDGRPVESLARAIGREGREVLEKLATPQTRLVMLEEQDQGWCYVLTHDRMAEVLVRLVDDQEAGAELGVDGDLLGLRRFVTLRGELFESGDEEQATEVPAAQYRRIERHADALLWGDEARRWWAACVKRRRTERRRRRRRRRLAAGLVALVALAAWSWAGRRAERRALLDQIAEGEPDAAFAALVALAAPGKVADDELGARLRRRPRPLDVLERGAGGAAPGERPGAVLRVAELALPLVDEAPDDAVRLASLVWALDAFAAAPGVAGPAAALRERALAPLRRRRPPPPGPPPGDPDWIDFPAGTFAMGAGPGEPGEGDERPRHEVALSAFRMARHEVTHADYRRLVPGHPGEDDRPAAHLSWYEAVVYAAWRGGRLPTEAEWEYAARAGCDFRHCRAGGGEAALGEVAWWVGNAADPRDLVQTTQPVGRLAPGPRGLFDLFGNVSEMVSDWYGPYSASRQTDPPGPTASATGYRARRGGSAWDPAGFIRATARGGGPPEAKSRKLGFRLVLPPSAG